jgi:CDGSH-type Zn-finger protein
MDKESKIVKLKSDEKCSICTCGKSKNLPYCDNEHKKLNEEKGTSYKSLKIIPKSDVELKLYCSNWDSESS